MEFQFIVHAAFKKTILTTAVNLGSIHGEVGMTQMVLELLCRSLHCWRLVACIPRSKRDPNAGPHSNDECTFPDRLGDFMNNAPRYAFDAVADTVGANKYAELIAPKTRDHTCTVDRGGQTRRNLAKNGVTDTMPVEIVHRLEVIQISQQNSYTVIGA